MSSFKETSMCLTPTAAACTHQCTTGRSVKDEQRPQYRLCAHRLLFSFFLSFFFTCFFQTQRREGHTQRSTLFLSVLQEVGPSFLLTTQRLSKQQSYQHTGRHMSQPRYWENLWL